MPIKHVKSCLISTLMLNHCITMSYNCQLKYIAIENKCLTHLFSCGKTKTAIV